MFLVKASSRLLESWFSVTTCCPRCLQSIRGCQFCSFRREIMTYIWKIKEVFTCAGRWIWYFWRLLARLRPPCPRLILEQIRPTNWPCGKAWVVFFVLFSRRKSLFVCMRNTNEIFNGAFLQKCFLREQFLQLQSSGAESTLFNFLKWNNFFRFLILRWIIIWNEYQYCFNLHLSSAVILLENINLIRLKAPCINLRMNRCFGYQHQ